MTLEKIHAKEAKQQTEVGSIDFFTKIIEQSFCHPGLELCESIPNGTRSFVTRFLKWRLN